MVLARFRSDRRGGVAPLLALSIIPIMGAVAMAVDYSRANVVHAAMQSSLDSAGLMLSKTAKDLSNDSLNLAATDYFKATFNHPEARDVAVAVNMTQPFEGVFKLTMSANATVDTVMGNLSGKSTLDLSANAEVVWGIKKLNLALALDNTGSMSSSGKMAALKTAAHNLLSTLQGASRTPGDIQVSIIPFATDVNIGTGNVGANWVHWTDWESKNGTCSRNTYTNQSDCVGAGKTWTPAPHSQWNGCVFDRDQNNDVSNAAAVSGTASSMYRAHQASACPTQMMALSTDWTALNAKVDAMQPTGNTNVTIGLQMAWQSLSPVAPFNAPAAATDLEKVIVLLTDGDNTQNRWTSSTSSIDSRTEKACTNAKADNIRIYTVRVINGDATLLRNCASTPSMYYDVQDAAQLNTAFGAIAQNLANLRIAK